MKMVIHKRRWASALLVTGLTLGAAPGLSGGQTATNRPAVEKTPNVEPDGSSTQDKNNLSTTPSPIVGTTDDRVGRVLPTAEPLARDTTVNVRPDFPEQNELSESLKEQINLFEQRKEEFLKLRQAEIQKLLERYKGATEEERRKLREQFKDRRDRWLEISKERRVEADLRQRALEAKLKAHQELLQQAREAKEQALDQARENRRGRDD